MDDPRSNGASGFRPSPATQALLAHLLLFLATTVLIYLGGLSWDLFYLSLGWGMGLLIHAISVLSVLQLPRLRRSAPNHQRRRR